MSNYFSPAARAAQEAARHADGKFGAQGHSAPAHELPASLAAWGDRDTAISQAIREPLGRYAEVYDLDGIADDMLEPAGRGQYRQVSTDDEFWLIVARHGPHSTSAQSAARERWRQQYDDSTQALHKTLVSASVDNIRNGDVYSDIGVAPDDFSEDGDYFAALDRLADDYTAEFNTYGLSSQATEQIDGAYATFLVDNASDVDAMLDAGIPMTDVAGTWYQRATGDGSFTTRGRWADIDPDVPRRLDSAHDHAEGVFRISNGDLVRGDDGRLYWD